jgi:hypothetical protein
MGLVPSCGRTVGNGKSGNGARRGRDVIMVGEEG